MARAPFLDKFHSGSHMRRGVLHSTEHVLSNLEAILNTKEGFGYFVRGFGLQFDAPVLASVDAWALALAIAAALAVFRFKIGMVATLAGAAAAGVALRLAGWIA